MILFDLLLKLFSAKPTTSNTPLDVQQRLKDIMSNLTTPGSLSVTFEVTIRKFYQ